MVHVPKGFVLNIGTTANGVTGQQKFYCYSVYDL